VRLGDRRLWSHSAARVTFLSTRPDAMTTGLRVSLWLTWDEPSITDDHPFSLAMQASLISCPSTADASFLAERFLEIPARVQENRTGDGLAGKDPGARFSLGDHVITFWFLRVFRIFRRPADPLASWPCELRIIHQHVVAGLDVCLRIQRTPPEPIQGFENLGKNRVRRARFPPALFLRSTRSVMTNGSCVILRQREFRSIGRPDGSRRSF
jgi:hypothetical protein